MEKKLARRRRAARTRAVISEVKAMRLAVHRSNNHIYAQVIDGVAAKVIASASSVEADLRKASPKGDKGGGKGNSISAASEVGKRIAERAKRKGVESVAFDRAGFKYHGRVKALAEAAREAGLKF